MTYEYAAYLKLLLLCGYDEELQQYIDDAVVNQNPISDIVLKLLSTNSDSGKMLSVLNEYLRQAKDIEIDYDKTVFNYILSFLKRKYYNESMPMKELTGLMNQIAEYSERDFVEPWETMYLIDGLFNEAEVGYIDKESFMQNFYAFLNDGVCLCDCEKIKPKENAFKRFIKKIFVNR